MKTKSNILCASLRVLLPLTLQASLIPAAHAQTEFVWSSSASSNSLSLAGNWDGGVVPATATTPTTSQNTDILVFNNAAQAGSLSWGGNRNMGGIAFRGAAVGSYTIATGGANPRAIMTLGGNISMDAAVLNPQTLVRLGFSGSTGNYTIENLATSPDATLTVSSSIDNYTTGAMNLILSGSNTGSNTLANDISENTGAGALALEKNGLGTWVLQGTNTYNGGTTLTQGVLALRSSLALGSGTLTINGGTIESVVSPRTPANNITVNGNFQVGGVAVPGLSVQATTFAGTVDLGGGNRTITLGTSAAFSNVVSNGGLTIEASGNATFTLAGNSTYTGPTNVNGGTLRINGDNSVANGAISVANGAALGGNGTSGAAVAIAANGKLAAGISDWTGAAGTGYDDLAVASLNVGGALTVVINTSGLTNFSEVNKSFTILNTTGGITNFNPANVTFSTTGFSGTGTWSLSQVGNSLVLNYAIAVADSYLAWATGAPYNLAGADALPNSDPDFDGIANSVEFVIGGNPAAASNVNLLPTSEIIGSNLVFTYRRSDLSAYLNPTVQYGSDLSGWTTAVNGEGGVTIGAPTDLGGGIKQIVVTIPMGANTRLFARLNVVVP